MFLQTKRTLKLFLYLLIISGLGVLSGYSEANMSSQSTQKRNDLLSKVALHKNLQRGRVLGDYGTILRKKRSADGRHVVNTPAMIKQLKKLHINTYFFPVFHEKSDWHDLHKFLPAAQKAGIIVVVLLIPPAEVKNKKPYPYGTDYIQWAKAIAQVSLKYPNLRGWTIDDFSSHQDTFTPSYVKKLVQSAHNINPELKFTPIVYYAAASCPCFHRKYSSYIDGLIMPYHIFYDVKPLTNELNAITNIWPPNKVILMAYATRNSNALFSPPANYVREVLQKGLSYENHGKRLAGVVTYKLAKMPQIEHNSICRNFSRGLNLQVGKGPTNAGDYAEASYEVHPYPTADNYRISFLYRDSRGTSDPKGYHIEQFLVDGHVVWDKDVAADGASKPPHKASLDLTKYLQAKKNARITFRLYEKHGVGNYSVLVSVSSVQGEGFNISDFSNSGWTFSTKGPKIISAKEYGPPPGACDIHREQKMFNAVEQLYGSWPGC
jgi:hypothetical protein